ncbi:MAG: hypothetical protein HYV65_00010 [Candidatus Spechtbacteria bacterium]|nr:hypothetical protein [Candidatus Spechtbacteria bacterium]
MFTFSQDSPLQQNGSPSQGHQGPRFSSGKNTGDDLVMDDFYTIMDRARTNGWGFQLAIWFQQNRARVMMVIAGIALIAAGAFIAFRVAPSFSTNFPEKLVASLSQKDSSAPVSSISSANSNMRVQIGPDGKTIQVEGPAVSQQGDFITEQAVRGEGMTHLARHAITRYLKDKNITLSPEQRVYAEDFARKAMGPAQVHVGDNLSFSTQLLDQSITKAQNLSEGQIHNLSKYSAHVKF